MRIGLFVGVTGPITFAEALAAAQQAERAELDTFWLPNIFALDALTSLAAIGGQQTNGSSSARTSCPSTRAIRWPWPSRR